MQKSADAFRTISEVADDLSLPQHVLRFWETRFPQIRPLKRAGGRRYYRPADVSLLRAIRQLLYEDGYTIKGVQRLLKEQGVKELGTGTRLAGQAEMPPDLLQGHDDEGLDDALLVEAPFADPVRSNGDGAVPRAEGSRPGYRGLIEEALESVEDCKRLLDTLLQEKR